MQALAQVTYYDGEEGVLHLAVERVRLLMHAGENFVPASPAELEVMARGLLSSANAKAALSPRTRKQCTSPAKLQAVAQGQSQSLYAESITFFTTQMVCDALLHLL